MAANVYDFDKTIYDGDSTVHFYFYCLKKYPRILLYLPKQGFYFILLCVGLVTKTKCKEKFYTFFKEIPDIEKCVQLFWEQKKDGIKQWYLQQQQSDDIVISASPEFLLRPLCSSVGIKNLAASRVDCKTGKYSGENCHGREKVNRFYAQFPNIEINEFYSDSYSDTPLAEIARKSFIVSGNKRSEWKKKK